ncbi:hypothetical protein BGW39_007528 [Mortierella sp. 14UC]|nr:hypothetical protein BGW39_007528 [Mortierella sp. 14UC]
MHSTFRDKLSVFAILSVFWLFHASSIAAQSPHCYNCVQKTIPKVQNCTTLTLKQYTTLEKVMYGAKLYETSPHCLDPAADCSWNEMMLYMGLIPRTASVYGAQSAPAPQLIDDPK